MTYKPAKRRVWQYNGDVNIEHGGFFFCTDTWHWDYVDVVRCVPASDMEGPDNVFLIEKITVNIPKDPKKVHEAMRAAGWLEGRQPEELLKLGQAGQRQAMVDACLNHGYCDYEGDEWIQIGKPSAFFDHRRPWISVSVTIKQLRGNTSLRNYVRSQCK